MTTLSFYRFKLILAFCLNSMNFVILNQFELWHISYIYIIWTISTLDIQILNDKSKEHCGDRGSVPEGTTSNQNVQMVRLSVGCMNLIYGQWNLYIKFRPLDQHNVDFIRWWSLYSGSITWKVDHWGPVNSGLYTQMVLIYRCFRADSLFNFPSLW